MARTVSMSAVLAVLAAVSAGAIAARGGSAASEAATPGIAPGGFAEASKRPIRFEVHDLFIEFNATDRDAGVQMNLDGEDWTRFSLRDPKGEVLVEVTGRSEIRDNGLTELFFEGAEPPLNEVPFGVFKKRFPEGRYTFRGRTVEGRRLVGSDRFTHEVPDGPVVTSPRKGAVVDPNGFTITWEPVTKPAGIEIARYIVIVTQGARELTMPLPSRATSATIPGQFLTPGGKGELEVLAREKSGNQTITAVPFKTG